MWAPRLIFSYGTACQVPTTTFVARVSGRDGPQVRRMGCSRAGDGAPWSRWSARSEARTNDLDHGVAAATPSSVGPRPWWWPGSEVCVCRRGGLARPVAANLVFAGRSRACLQSAGRCPRLGTLVLTDEPSQRSNGGLSCHGGAPAAHGELGHRRPRPSTDGTGGEALTPPSRRRGGRRADERWPPRRRRAPTCGRRGSGSVDTGRPAPPRPGPGCRAPHPLGGA